MKNKKPNTTDYTTSFTAKKSPRDVFSAINDVRGWWIGDIEGHATNEGDEFTYSFKDLHKTTQKIVKSVPNKKIVWLVTKSKINFVKDKNEWKNTEITFELKPNGDGTKVTFTHAGLNKSIECFDACSGGWDFYLARSLRNFILKGKGVAPNF